MVWPNGASTKALLLGDPFQVDYGPGFERPYNAANHLNLPTPSTPEAIHPDVLDMGTAWNGYRYWMAMTPYNGDDNTETPCILATNSITDGGTWEVPSGFTNPITADPAGASHMADTDLWYDPSSDRLHVLYIVTDESTFQSIRYRYTTGDGTWVAEATVLAGALNAYTNPSILRVGSNWRIYYTLDSGAIDGVYYRESATGPVSGYGNQVTCDLSLTFGVMARKAQNINAFLHDGTVCLLISDGNAAGRQGALYFARSTDGGDSFDICGGPVIEHSVSGWDSGGIYRASVLTDTTGEVVVDNGMIHLWYSAFLPNVVDHGTGYTQLPESVLGG